MKFWGLLGKVAHIVHITQHNNVIGQFAEKIKTAMVISQPIFAFAQ